MPLGPFDRRKKRSRCLACAASHVKCSGTAPCANCQRRQIVCDFSPVLNQPLSTIRIDNGSPSSKCAGTRAVTVSSKPDTQSRRSRLQLCLHPQTDAAEFFYRYFDTLLSYNSFTHRNIFSPDVVRLIQLPTSGSYIRDAVLALGAMYAVKLGSPDGPGQDDCHRVSAHHYTKSIIGLRAALDQFAEHPDSRLEILWTTHMLGLFELLTDATGEGWLKHLVRGTSCALIATGPAVFESGLNRRFFLEIRVFEVVRSIVFNEPSFLTDPQWQVLSSKLGASAGDSDHPFDSLLDIIPQCSAVRVRARNLIEAREQQDWANATIMQAQHIAKEGFSLRQALVCWQAVQLTLETDRPLETLTPHQDSFISLAMVFFSATMIYLSGVFDYEMIHWNEMGIMTPTMGEDEIQAHVGSIISRSAEILGNSTISALLLLFPLRVAGARARSFSHQTSILSQLDAVMKFFPVASGFKSDLKSLWAYRGW